jgi:hypothetical protein
MQKQNGLLQPIPAALAKCALTGGAIALVLISLFLSGVNHPNPSWPALWYLLPLIIVTLAGATGGAVYYFINRTGSRAGWPKIAIVIISLFIYVAGLWMGTVLGLDGTLWD